MRCTRLHASERYPLRRWRSLTPAVLALTLENIARGTAISGWHREEQTMTTVASGAGFALVAGVLV